MKDQVYWGSSEDLEHLTVNRSQPSIERMMNSGTKHGSSKKQSQQCTKLHKTSSHSTLRLTHSRFGSSRDAVLDIENM